MAAYYCIKTHCGQSVTMGDKVVVVIVIVILLITLTIALAVARFRH